MRSPRNSVWIGCHSKVLWRCINPWQSIIDVLFDPCLQMAAQVIFASIPSFRWCSTCTLSWTSRIKLLVCTVMELPLNFSEVSVSTDWSGKLAGWCKLLGIYPAKTESSCLFISMQCIESHNLPVTMASQRLITPIWSYPSNKIVCVPPPSYITRDSVFSVVGPWLWNSLIITVYTACLA